MSISLDSFALSNDAEINVSAEIFDKDAFKEKVAAKISKLAPLPALALEILQTAESENVDFDKLAKKIANEPIVTAKILKFANSAANRAVNELKTLEECITRLGLDRVKNLCIACCLSGSVDRSFKCFPYENSGFWQHALVVGQLTKLVADHFELEELNRCELFLAGLLHDIGKLVADSFLDSPITSLGRTGVEEEIQLCGHSHTEIGVRVADKWNLPNYINCVIAGHHQVSAGLSYPEHTAVVHIADIISNNLQYGLAEHAAEVVLDDIQVEALNLLEISKEQLGEFYESILEQKDSLDAICQIMK